LTCLDELCSIIRTRYQRLKQREEDRPAQGRVSISADRREDQGVGRLAGRDAISDPGSDQAGRPRRRRGVEVEGCSGVVSQRADLHRRDVQERREDDLLQGRLAEGPFGPLQLQSRR
jgi:hypothetical protein